MVFYDREEYRADLGYGLTPYSTKGLSEFIANDVFVQRNVGTENGWYPSKSKKDSLKRIEDIERKRGTGYKRVDFNMGNDSYETVNHGVEGVVTDEAQYGNRTDFDTELEVANDTNRIVLIDREIRVKSALMNATTFTGTGYFKDYKATPWSTLSTDVVTQINFAKTKVRKNSGRADVYLTIGYDAYQNLLQNAGIVSRLSTSSNKTEEAVKQALASILGLKGINVGLAIYDSANEGGAFVGADVWPTKYASVHCVGDDRANVGVGINVNWDIVGDGSTSVVTYRDMATKSNVIRVEDYSKEKLVSKDLGFLLQIETA